jgi:hypothetical protein
MSRVEVDLEDEDSRKLWSAVCDLVDRLPAEWVLVGV